MNFLKFAPARFKWLASRCVTGLLVTIAFAAGAPAAHSGSQVLWGMGDNFGGARNSPLYQDVQLMMMQHWYNGPADLSWIRGYKNQTQVSDIYGQGKAIELVIWLAASSSTQQYAISPQFQTDLRELVQIFKGNGPNYGPLYVVMFTEIGTYGAISQDDLRTAYMNSINTIHSEYSKSYVGLGFGGYWWTSSPTATANLSAWDSCIRASDFAAVQQMQDYTHTTQQINGTKAAIAQLGTYNLPVMISHFKIWANDGNQAGIRAAFNTYMDAIFTDTQLDTLVSQGLFAWGWMDDYYIKSADATYDRAKNFINLHNQFDAYPRRESEYTPISAANASYYTAAESGPSQGKLFILDATGVGDYVIYHFPVNKIGTYTIKVRVKKRVNRGQFQLSIGGANQGAVQDLYATSDTYTTLNLGTKTFTATGDKTFKFNVTGKLSSSSGYTLGLDYLQLVPN